MERTDGAHCTSLIFGACEFSGTLHLLLNLLLQQVPPFDQQFLCLRRATDDWMAGWKDRSLQDAWSLSHHWRGRGVVFDSKLAAQATSEQQAAPRLHTSPSFWMASTVRPVELALTPAPFWPCCPPNMRRNIVLRSRGQPRQPLGLLRTTRGPECAWASTPVPSATAASQTRGTPAHAQRLP